MLAPKIQTITEYRPKTYIRIRTSDFAKRLAEADCPLKLHFQARHDFKEIPMDIKYPVPYFHKEKQKELELHYRHLGYQVLTASDLTLYHWLIDDVCLVGRPDLTVMSETEARVIEIKSTPPQPADKNQLRLYMYQCEAHFHRAFDGEIHYYSGERQVVSHKEITERLKGWFRFWAYQYINANHEPKPSEEHCRWCQLKGRFCDRGLK